MNVSYSIICHYKTNIIQTQLYMSTENQKTRPNTPDMEIGGDAYMMIDG